MKRGKPKLPNMFNQEKATDGKAARQQNGKGYESVVRQELLITSRDANSRGTAVTQEDIQRPMHST